MLWVIWSWTFLFQRVMCLRDLLSRAAVARVLANTLLESLLAGYSLPYTTT